MHVGGDGLTPSPAQANPNPAETIVPWTPPVIVPPRVPVVEAPVVEPPVVEPPVVEPPVIDAGTVELTQQTAAEWTTVGFDTPFDDPPVVVAGPPTAGEADAAVVQVRNVTTSEFEIRLREWDHLDGPHARELVSWIASMPGTHVVDGNVVTAGVADAIGSSWQRVDYPAFSARPVVLTQSMGDENDAPTVVAVKRLNRFGFTARLRGTEGSTITATQSVGFIALERGRIDVGDTRLVAGVRAITDRWKRVADRPAGTKPGILGNLQSNREPDPTTLRIRYRGDRVQIRMNEDTMLDSETSHRRERIGWVRIVPVD